jgi:hypothetical protein
MAKTFRSANGKQIDFDRIRLQNEDVIAVGNMRVNARGDELGPGGRVVKTRNERMNENYKLHSMIPKSDKVHSSTAAAKAAQKQELAVDIVSNKPEVAPTKQEVKEVKETKTKTTKAKESAPAPTGPNFGNLTYVDDAEVPVVSQTKKPRGGLAASVASPTENESSIPVVRPRRI